MFFSNMQSFYRRNSIHSQAASPSTKSSKDIIKRIKHIGKHKNDEDDDDDNYNYHRKNNPPIRRSSFSISRNTEYEEPVENNFKRTNVPVIKIGLYEPETSKKAFNILREKEKALWHNSSPVLDDNAERLGPNKNNIIEETLQIERRKSGDWGQ